MKQEEIISLIIPQSGRTFENFMTKIKDLVEVNNDIDLIIKIVKAGKKEKSPNITDVLNFLNKYQNEVNSISIFIDRKRAERPYRIGFVGRDFLFKEKNIDVRIEGAEPHNCSTLVSLGEADLALAGFDELLTTTQEKLTNPSLVTKWGSYNYNLPKSKKIRIAGSAMLKIYNSALDCYIQDIVGFFLISKNKIGKNFNYPDEYLKHLEKHKNIVYVKGRYSDIVRTAYPKLNVISVHDVEDAVADSRDKAVGLEIVQSGSTLKKKGLFLLGTPLFLSESLYVVNYYSYLKNQELKDILKTLNPTGYYEENRLEQFAKWFYSLELNLGENWINKPTDITTLLCEDEEMINGLRPYRLETRYWSASDNYKTQEAYDMIEKAKENLLFFYDKIKKTDRV